MNLTENKRGIPPCPLGKMRTDEPCCSYNPEGNHGVGRATHLIGWTWIVSLHGNNIPFCSLWCAERFLNIKGLEIANERSHSGEKTVYVSARPRVKRHL